MSTLAFSLIEVLHQLGEIDVEFDAAPHKRDLSCEAQLSDCVVAQTGVF